MAHPFRANRLAFHSCSSCISSFSFLCPVSSSHVQKALGGTLQLLKPGGAAESSRMFRRRSPEVNNPRSKADVTHPQSSDRREKQRSCRLARHVETVSSSDARHSKVARWQRDQDMQVCTDAASTPIKTRENGAGVEALIAGIKQKMGRGFKLVAAVSRVAQTRMSLLLWWCGSRTPVVCLARCWWYSPCISHFCSG